MTVLTQPNDQPFTAQFQPERFFYTREMHGGDAAEALARLGADAGQSADKLTQMISDNSVRDVRVKAAQLEAHTLDQLHQAELSGDPNNLTAVTDNLQQDTQNLVDNSTTRAGQQTAQGLQADLHSRIGDLAYQTGVRMNANNLVTGLDTFTNSQAAIVQQSGYSDQSIQQAYKNLDAYSATFTGIPSDTAQKVVIAKKQTLASMAYGGRMMQNPAAFMKSNISDQFLTPEARESLNRGAVAMRNADVEQQLLNIRLKEAQEAAATQKLLDDNTDNFNKGNFTTPMQAAVSANDWKAVDTISHLQEQYKNQGGFTTPDPSTYLSLQKDIMSGKLGYADAPLTIDDAVSKNLILPQDAKDLIQYNELHHKGDPITQATEVAYERAASAISSGALYDETKAGSTQKVYQKLMSGVADDQAQGRDPKKFTLNPDYSGSPLSPAYLAGLMSSKPPEAPDNFPAVPTGDALAQVPVVEGKDMQSFTGPYYRQNVDGVLHLMRNPNYKPAPDQQQPPQ